MVDESLRNTGGSSADGERQGGKKRREGGKQGENRGILRSRCIYSWKRRVTHIHTLEAILVLLLNNATALRSEGLLLY